MYTIESKVSIALNHLLTMYLVHCSVRSHRVWLSLSVLVSRPCLVTRRRVMSSVVPS